MCVHVCVCVCVCIVGIWLEFIVLDWKWWTKGKKSNTVFLNMIMNGRQILTGTRWNDFPNFNYRILFRGFYLRHFSFQSPQTRNLHLNEILVSSKFSYFFFVKLQPFSDRHVHKNPPFLRRLIYQLTCIEICSEYQGDLNYNIFASPWTKRESNSQV